MTNPEIDRFNVLLTDRYGQTLNGSAHFRVVWSEDMYEVRVGTFNEFMGSIFVRQYIGAKTVPKYNYIHNRWILEMWHPAIPSAELPDPDGYECIYVFESARGDPLPVKWEPIELICWCILNPLERAENRRILDEMLAKQYKDEVEYFYDMIEISKLQSQFMAHEAVILGGNNGGNKN